MASDEPKQPEWPINVMIFKPGDDVADIKKRIKPTEDPITYFDEGKKWTHNSDHHFSTKRFALLFAPGEYKDCQFEVGYYVQMAGLGKVAKGKGAVIFNGEKSGPFVPALNKDSPVTEGGSIPYPGSGLCLDTFWRIAENFSAENVQWAVSQAAPLRRVYVRKNLEFGDGGAYSSGGFLSNAEVDGDCNYIANQQWFSRAVNFKGNVSGGAWSIVFAGCTGNTPPMTEGTPMPMPAPDKCVVTVEDIPKVRLEKPYIVLNENGDYELHVPQATTDEKLTTGPHLDDSNTEIRCFSKVKVGKAILPLDEDGNYIEYDDDNYNDLTDADKELTLELQQALDEGKDLVLCPGIYFLSQPLVVKKENQVILGIGIATLIAPQDGSPCIRVQTATHGVRVASMVLEASVQKESSSVNNNSDKVKSLIDFGEPDKTGIIDPGNPSNPGLISDIFTRVGGSNLDRSVKTDVMVRIFSGNVVGDNLWLWRADHVKNRPGEKLNDPNFPYHQVRIWEEVDGKQVRVDECMVNNAIVVYGNHVNIYGLFAEHTVEDQMIWKGEHGSVCFFQCELPYDVNAEFSHTGYHVHKDVEIHHGRGIGVYSNFSCFDVVAAKGLMFPDKELISIQNPFTVFLNGKGGIEKVLHKGEEKVGETVSELTKIARGWIGYDSE